MMNSESAYGHLERCGLMAGMRGQFPPDVACAVSAVLMEEGIQVFEFLMNSVQPIESMQAVKHAYGDHACVGMGTVLDAHAARLALDAGADFLVSPAFNPAVVSTAQARDVLVAPGVITPSEIVNAWEMGVRLVKLFPIGALGVDYFRAIRGPLDQVRFLCNGAMNDHNVRQFLEAGAVACGMGDWLTGKGDMPLDTIRKRARLLRQTVDEVRTGRKPSVTI